MVWERTLLCLSLMIISSLRAEDALPCYDGPFDNGNFCSINKAIEVP
jgi:hypothetical protein